MEARIAGLALAIASVAFSQVARETPPSVDAYVGSSVDIVVADDFQAPRMEGSLKAVPENLPRVRTHESIVEEVRALQGRLKHLYKIRRMRAEDIGRLFSLTLVINADGGVDKVVVNGVANKAFRAEVEANVKTWGFSGVQEKRPVTANLKNLDFMYRRELVLD